MKDESIRKSRYAEAGIGLGSLIKRLSVCLRTSSQRHYPGKTKNEILYTRGAEYMKMTFLYSVARL